jgi:putative hemolysin
MSAMLLECLFILALILANGAFALSGLAIVSARKARLQQWANGGNRRARAALELANDPNRALSTVQVGITLVGTLAGVFGGATLAERLAGRLRLVPALAPYGHAIGLGVVVVGIAYGSLILGELVPKRLALSRPEAIAALVAGPLRLLCRVGIPVVQVVSGSAEVVLRVLGVRPAADAPVTEEEIKVLIKEGTQAGVFEEAEHDMVRQVFRLGDRRAHSLMTRRAEIIWLDVADPPEEIRRKITESPHSRFPVCEGSLDNVLGIVQVKDLLIRAYAGRPFDIKGLLIVPLFIYEGATGLKVLELFKTTGTHVAMVLDEYGCIEGLLTLNDILEAIVGDLTTGAEPDPPMVVQRQDGSWLLDGMLAIDQFQEQFAVATLPEGDYQTLAGFVIAHLGHIPRAADGFEWGGFRFEVVDMDANRVDKILLNPLPRPDP